LTKNFVIFCSPVEVNVVEADELDRVKDKSDDLAVECGLLQDHGPYNILDQAKGGS
jgi:hypothetical protein